MSTAKAKNGLANESRAPEASSQGPALRIAPGTELDQGPLLAQIPDLDLNASPDVPEKKGEGRVISQALSIKLVFGVGFALLLAAILPFFFGRASRPERPVSELPEWSSAGGSMRITDGASQTVAPAWPALATAPTSAVSTQTQPTPPPAIVSAQPPLATDTRPPGLTEPSWSPPRSSASPAPAFTPSPAPNNYINPPVANANWPSNNFANPPSVNTTLPDNRGFDRPADPRNFQADNRNDPAAAYRNSDPRFESRGGTIDPSPIRRDVLPGGYPGDPRFETPNNTVPPSTAPGSPLMPSNVQAPMSANPYPPVSEPGVARFDGTIATPPARMSYDRSGSNAN